MMHPSSNTIWLCATLAAIFLVTCTGCTTTPVTQIVKVPVPMQCQETVPDRPAMPTEGLKAGATSLHQYVTASQAEIERREGYEGKLRAALVACMGQ